MAKAGRGLPEGGLATLGATMPLHHRPLAMAPEGQRPSIRRRSARRGESPRRVIVSVCDEAGRPLPTGLARWLARVAPPRARGVVNVAVVSDARVRQLNRQHRRRDYATDVLSFPAGDDLSARRTLGKRHTATPFLGDIVIARGVARRQARSAGHAEATELRVLALHGLLHLLGYDHERDMGQMARLERRLRRRAGLCAGLIERVNR